jgi:hypothetical protein
VFIPRHWIRARRRVTGPDGRELEITAWGWSASDLQEAERKAQDRLATLAARAEAGDPFPERYPYGARPLREEIVEEVRSGNEIAGIVTRNGYGALVLNARQALFIDVDRPAPPSPGLLGRLFGKPASAGDDGGLTRIREALRAASAASFRIYATAGGYRVLATDPVFEPGQPPAEDLMTATGADPMFIQLCRAQRSFRARLTPKPWRCGARVAPGQHPREDGEGQREFARWLEGYERACESRAVCRLVDEVGWGRIHPEIRPILERHDAATRVSEPLPLA